MLIQQEEHNNARGYLGQLTRDKFEKLGYEVLTYPAYNTEVIPSDFYLFGLFKNALLGKRGANNEEVKEALQKWLRDQPKQFFANAISQIQKR